VRWILAALVVAVLAAGLWFLRRGGDQPPAPAAAAKPAPAPSTRGKPDFIGSKRCRTCHEDRHAAWLKTAHAYSLRAASEGSIRGRFDGRPVTSRYFTATPYMRDGAYHIRLESKDSRPSGDYTVSRVVGRAFEQAYLFTGPHGEWRVLPICWSIERKQWDLTQRVLADIIGEFGKIPDSYDTRNHIFNHGCGQCHATNYDVGHSIDPQKPSTYHSTFLEGAVACESCHGPGSIHAAWHAGAQEPEGAYKAPARLLSPAKDLDAKGVLDSCGRCHYLHEWRYAIADDPRVPYADIAVSLNYDGPGFFADGRLAGLNYHGTTQSQSMCYRKGKMSCLSCHRMHGGKPWALKWSEKSDRQCTQCHQEVADLGVKHSFHKAGQTSCVDCHMPRFLTGPLHFLRDHRIRSPEPVLTERFGADRVPNACNVCHKDQTAAWARKWKETWYGPAPDRLKQDVAQVVALRLDPSRIATGALAATARREKSDHFFRMTALKNLEGRLKEPEALSTVRAMLDDPDPELTMLACEIFGRHPDPAAAEALLRLAAHPVRTIRVEAAYALARVGWRGTTPAMEQCYLDAVAMLDRQRHFSTALVRICMLADALAKPRELEKYFRELVRLAKPGRWPRVYVELLHRRARWLTENQNHKDALVSYAQIRELYGKPMPPLLVFDSADSLEGAGLAAQALGNWQLGLKITAPDSPLHLIAEAQIAAHTPGADLLPYVAKLQNMAAQLSREPTGGQYLVRVRYALKDLERR